MSYYDVSKGTCTVLLCKTCGRYTVKIQYTTTDSGSEDIYTDFLVLKKNSDVEKFVKTKKYLELIKTSEYWLLGDWHDERVKIMDQYVERKYYEHGHVWCQSEC